MSSDKPSSAALEAAQKHCGHGLTLQDWPLAAYEKEVMLMAAAFDAFATKAVEAERKDARNRVNRALLDLALPGVAHAVVLGTVVAAIMEGAK